MPARHRAGIRVLLRSEVNVFPESVASMTLVYRPPLSALPP
jgi:hypothetical protein